MLDPAAAPSRKRVIPSQMKIQNATRIPISTAAGVTPRMRTAATPKIGPHCMTRCAPSRSARTPKIGERVSSAAK